MCVPEISRLMRRPEAFARPSSRRSLRAEVVDVDLDVLHPFVREVLFGVDRLDGTLVDTQSTIDAGVGIDEQLRVLLE